MLTGQESTIEDFIKGYNEQSISVDKLYYKEADVIASGKILVLPESSILAKYNDMLKEHIVLLTLSDQETNMYWYNPKRLSMTLYKTVEYWSLLLHANEIYSVCQFTLNPVKIYDMQISSIISDILNLEKTSIDRNTNDIQEAIK